MRRLHSRNNFVYVFPSHVFESWLLDNFTSAKIIISSFAKDPLDPVDLDWSGFLKQSSWMDATGIDTAQQNTRRVPLKSVNKEGSNILQLISWAD